MLTAPGAATPHHATVDYYCKSASETSEEDDDDHDHDHDDDDEGDDTDWPGRTPLTVMDASTSHPRRTSGGTHKPFPSPTATYCGSTDPSPKPAPAPDPGPGPGLTSRSERCKKTGLIQSCGTCE
jgi:hypothetical protein